MLRIERFDPRAQDRKAFDCGESSLNGYLQELAGQHLRDGIATTQFLVDDEARSRIVGFYTLGAAQFSLDELQIADRRRLRALRAWRFPRMNKVMGWAHRCCRMPSRDASAFVVIWVCACW